MFADNAGEYTLNLIRLRRIPCLAMVDINIPPGMDGFAFCRGAHKRGPGLPVIILTGVGDEATIVKPLDDYLAEDYVVRT